MKRRDFLHGGIAITIAPSAARKAKPIHALVWMAHDTDALRISLIYADRSSIVTTIPAQWLFDHPIESMLLANGTTDHFKLDWVDLCAEVVEMYVNGR